MTNWFFSTALVNFIAAYFFDPAVKALLPTTKLTPASFVGMGLFWLTLAPWRRL